jgi:hypothetical protein
MTQIKWDRSIGTSKREQGVTTPPATQHPKRRIEFLTVRPARERFVTWKNGRRHFIGWA